MVLKCGAETHLFFSHLAIDASDTSASRTLGPCRPASPIAPSEASYEGRSELEECLDNDGRSVASTVCITKRHKTSRFGLFLLAICEIGCTYKKKVPLGVRLISTRRSEPRGFFKTKFRGPEIKNLDRGCATPVVLVAGGPTPRSSLCAAKLAGPRPLVEFIGPSGCRLLLGLANVAICLEVATPQTLRAASEILHLVVRKR